MMATLPLFSATITTSHPCQTYIRAPSEYFLHSNTTNKTCIPIIVITNQHHVLSTTAQPEPHHTPHKFHVPGQSYRERTSSRGHGSQSPQGLTRISVSTLWSTSRFIICSFYYHMLSKLTPYMFMFSSV